MRRDADMSSSRYIKNFDELARSDLHRMALELIEVGLRAADPRESVKKALTYDRVSKVLKVFGEEIRVRGSIHVVGFGKASKGMVEGVYEVLNDAIVGGVAISPDYEGHVGPVEIVKGDHPIPGENTLKASRKLIEYLQSNVDEDDVVLVLISGGGSALFEVPAEGIELADIAKLSRELMKRGADIVELNAVRKHLSKVKGGGLLRFINAEQVVALIISDVVGDRLDTIASGPTAPDETTFRDAFSVLQKYGLWNELPENIRSRIVAGLRGEIEETVKPGDPILSKVRNFIVASNTISLSAMHRRAQELGFNPIIVTPYIEGEAREVAKVLGAIIKSAKDLDIPVPRPAAIIAGGETTVTVRGNGVGGRNQELCLALSLRIAGLRDVVAVCIGSDGVDGISPAAGAIVDGEVVEEAKAKGLDPRRYLEENDSYTFFSKLGRAIYTGYTGTNVNDFFVALIK